MHTPPFKLALSPVASAAGATPGYGLRDCCEPGTGGDEAAGGGRARLTQLDPHLHCSVIGTCLSTAELRKLMARFMNVQGASDLEVHHEAVREVTQRGSAAKVLSKALDQRHDAVVQRFARARGPAELEALWDEAVHQGEVPGAYWAVLTHRATTAELRQKAFGDVHMLSHLVGSSHRADIRKLTALEAENADLRERLGRLQARSNETLGERDATLAELRQTLAAARAAAYPAPAPDEAAAQRLRDESVADLVALQTERRERAEHAAASAAAECSRMSEELEHLHRHVATLVQELAVVEAELRAGGADGAVPGVALRGRRVLYVGGRPSSAPAIRDLVVRHGGEFQRHDGGLEDRKGLLASAVSWAQLVVFPVDCVDHDSAGNLKRLCARHDVPFLALRSASVASFAAALAAAELDSAGRPVCIKHG